VHHSSSEKLTALEIVQKFPAFYETARFIAVFTTACHIARSRYEFVQARPGLHILFLLEPLESYPFIYD
jgi:hypothetical protein